MALMKKSDYPILIVEDEIDVRELLKDIVSFEGFKAVTVENGNEAVSAIEKQRFQLVMLDLRLPGLSGIEVLRKIREITSGTPVIVVTGHPEDLKSIRNEADRPEMMVPKPFKLRQIKEALSKIGMGK